MERDEINDTESEHVPSDAQSTDRNERDRSPISGSASGTDGSDGGLTATTAPDEQPEESPLEGRLDGDEDPQQEQIAELVHAAIEAQLSESYSGLLPHPKHWDKFDDGTRERILRMSEAYTTDESARRDRITDAEISEAPKGRRNALWIMLGSMGCAAVSVFAFDNNIGAGIFLAVPVASIVRDFIRGRATPTTPSS